MHRALRIIGYISCTIGLLLCIAFWQNTDELSITYYEVETSKISNELDGYTILQISDIHNHGVNYSNANILNKIRGSNADAIFLTGDLIDSHTTSFDNVEQIVEECSKLTNKIYFCSGNHEAYAPANSEKLFEILDRYNVHRYEGTDKVVDQLETGVFVTTIRDPGYVQKDTIFFTRNEGDVAKQVEAIKDKINPDAFNICLSHRPELVNFYSPLNFDLVFAGHTHGNQNGLPGQWFALNQWNFHPYVYGKYQVNNTQMIVSAGLGYSWSMPFRIGRNAELVITKLRKIS